MQTQEEVIKEVNEFTENMKNLDITKLDYNSIFEKLLDWSATAGFKLVVGLIILSIGFKLISRLVNQLVKILEKKEVDITLIKFLNSLVSVGLKVALVMPIVAYWGVDLSGIAAIVASAGVAIGLALQGSLSNFAGGFIILFIRPFKVGDFIETTGYTGTVEQIGLFYTQLSTIDNKQILIPNGVLSNGSLINYSAKESRRVDVIFKVGYENDILKVKKIINDIISNHELAFKEPEPFIGINSHTAISIDFAVRVWCKNDDYWDLYHDLLEKVKIAFDKEGITVPYPHMDLHLNKK